MGGVYSNRDFYDDFLLLFLLNLLFIPLMFPLTVTVYNLIVLMGLGYHGAKPSWFKNEGNKSLLCLMFRRLSVLPVHLLLKYIATHIDYQPPLTSKVEKASTMLQPT